MFAPACPNAGPTGGAGFAFPAGICNLIILFTAFATRHTSSKSVMWLFGCFTLPLDMNLISTTLVYHLFLFFARIFFIRLHKFVRNPILLAFHVQINPLIHLPYHVLCRLFQFFQLALRKDPLQLILVDLLQYQLKLPRL